MDYSDLQLRNKTFLDFTTDKAVIEEVVGDKEFFLTHITEENRARTFMYFSDMTPDKQLAKAIVKEFGKEWELLHNE